MLDVSQFVRDKKAYVVATGLQNIPVDTEHDFLLLKNPSGNDLDLLISHMSVGTNSTSIRSIFKFYAEPTITTDGTSLGISKTYIGGSAPTPQAQAFLDPTISIRGEVINTILMPSNAPSRGSSRYFWVEPGSSILVTVTNTIANGKSFSEVYFLEGI